MQMINSSVVSLTIKAMHCSLTYRINSRPQYNLRTTSHNKELIANITELNSRDFWIRMLYKIIVIELVTI